MKELVADYHFLKENGIHSVADLQENINENKAQLSDLERERSNRVDIPSDRKHFSKTKPMELKHFDDCIAWWNNREVIPDGEYFKSQKFTADYLLNEQGCNIDLCGYPHEEEEVLDPLDTIREYQERRTSLNAEIDKVLAELEALLPGGVIK